MLNKLKYHLGFLTVLLICSCFLCSCSGLGRQEVLLESSQSADASMNELAKTEEVIEEGVSIVQQIIYVDVCGQVKHPGVYQLSADSRVYQAIDLAGGVTKKAAITAVNQAEPLVDGQQIYVPSKSEIRGDESAPSTGIPGGSSSVNGKSNTKEEGKMNLNTASKEELMTLSGIGDAKAEAIIKYRETIGPFSCVEDLMNVTGIGEGIFNKLKDDITVS